MRRVQVIEAMNFAEKCIYPYVLRWSFTNQYEMEFQDEMAAGLVAAYLESRDLKVKVVDVRCIR